jgi:hypothetical protein
LTGFTAEQLQKYLLLDDGQFIKKMNIIKYDLSKEFKKKENEKDINIYKCLKKTQKVILLKLIL